MGGFSTLRSSDKADQVKTLNNSTFIELNALAPYIMEGEKLTQPDTEKTDTEWYYVIINWLKEVLNF